MVKIDEKENLIRLVNQYKNLVFSICLKMTGDYFAAEDITQETFLKAYQKYAGFDGKNEKSWICRIAGNKCIDYLRAAERKSVPVPEEELAETSGAGENPVKIFEGRAVLEAVREQCLKLPKPYDDVGVSFFVEGLTAREIADQKGANLKTIQTQIYRAREMLKKSIRREDLLS